MSRRGAARDLLRIGLAGGVEIRVSDDVLVETRRNVADKAPEALVDLERFVAELGDRLVEPPRALVHEAAEVVAAKDAPIVAAAVHAGADYLATYDRRHLLSQRAAIEARFGVVVATPDKIARSLPAPE